MNRLLTACIILLSLSLFACKSSQKSGKSSSKKNGPNFIILQMNDVYEISPLQGGKVGGLARVAGLRKELLKECPNVITVLAGDFLNPSLIGTLYKEEDGRRERVAGEHMVEVLNALGLDYVTFGNHEFDLKEYQLVQRIKQSKFEWTSANVNRLVNGKPKPFDKAGKPVSRFEIFEVPLKKDSVLRVGLIGVTLPFNKEEYVEYGDPIGKFVSMNAAIGRNCDVVIGLTHLNREDDEKLAAKLPSLPLIMGGHEHDDTLVRIGNTVITKADANAKTVYVHRCKWVEGKLEVESTLVPVTDSLPSDTIVEMVVKTWEEWATSAIKKMGYDADAEIGYAKDPLDGTETGVRNTQTNLGNWICRAMLKADPKAKVAVQNGGAIRLDDKIQGPIFQADILKALPFGGSIVHAEMRGSELINMLKIGTVKNKGRGGYLQFHGIKERNGLWWIDGMPVSGSETYGVVMPEFVSKGRETNLEFLGELRIYTKPELEGVNGMKKNDIRDVVIKYIMER